MPVEIPSMSIMLHRSWWVLLLRGAAAIIFGVLTWMQPAASAAALVLVFGAYVFVDGLLGIYTAIKSRQQSRHWWVVLLWGLLGWKITVAYVAVGMLAGISGGLFMDAIKAERWLHPAILEALASMPAQSPVIAASSSARKISVRERHNFAWSETSTIFRRVWKWVIIGVALGAGLHGFVPDNWFAQHLGAGEWWSVPLSVLLGVPLYSSVTGIIPVMESLLVKGLPIGTTMAFCMSAVAASIPEVMMLRQIMTIKLQAAFIGYLWVIFTLVGWLFNILGPYIV